MILKVNTKMIYEEEKFKLMDKVKKGIKIISVKRRSFFKRFLSIEHFYVVFSYKGELHKGFFWGGLGELPMKSYLMFSLSEYIVLKGEY